MQKLLLITCFSLMMIAGCSQNEAEDIVNNKDQTNVITVNDKNNGKEQLTAEQIAKHLVELANDVPDVKDATAVVAGNYAIVGIDIDKDLERSRVGSIKYSVAETLKDDPYGANAVVVADADTVERLKQMREEIENGRPIEGVMDELAGIIGRIMPQVPFDLNTNEGHNEQNEQQIRKEEDKQLDQIQKEQSKQNM